MNTKTFDIEIIPGKTIKVTSNIDWSEGAPPFYCLPPSTEHCKPVARLNWGENMYGELTEDYYLVVDDPKNQSAWVLWVGDDGSQNDDHVARLCPAAWCEAVDPADVSTEDGKAIIAAALLYAWVRATRGESLYQDEPSTAEETGADDHEAILTPEVTRIVELALAGDPYVPPVAGLEVEHEPRTRVGRAKPKPKRRSKSGSKAPKTSKPSKGSRRPR